MTDAATTTDAARTPAAGQYRAADGRTFRWRRASPDDAEAVLRLYHRLSAPSFVERFHSAQVPDHVLTRGAAVDEATGAVCFVVTPAGRDDDDVVAEARYLPVAPGAAELAVCVLDEHQSAGLGRLLVRLLAEQAAAAGLDRLTAAVLLGNIAMLRVLAPYGWVLAEPADAQVALLEVSPTGDAPGWPPDAPAQARRVLVEGGGWLDDAGVRALRDGGDDVRRCLGPRPRLGRRCPLVASGRCRLAEQADVIVSLLPPDDDECAAVLAAHGRRWPDRLVPPPA